jgi:hypothetical protein
VNLSVTYSDGRHESVAHTERGLFGSILQARRERKQREAHAAREMRLIELERNIKALEAWHHEWRLRHDEDYRILHPGERCEEHDGPQSRCRSRHYRRVTTVDDCEIVTWSGRVLRSSTDVP